MYGYIYKTTNLINNKIYIGQHKRSKFDENYKGSGTLLKSAIRKYGWENFKCEILECCDSLSELNEREIYYISIFNSMDKAIGYNLCGGGSNPVLFGVSNPRYGKHLSQETREKIRLANTGKSVSAEAKLKMSVAKTGKTHDGWNGGKLWMNDGKSSIMVEKSKVEQYLNRGYCLGRLTSKTDYKDVFKDRVHINKAGKEKYIKSAELNEYLNDGWSLGRLPHSSERGHNISLGKSGKIRIQNGDVIKYIESSELSKYEKLGFSRTSTNRKKTS